ncbi:hypothetical protein D6D23_04672 [Aureobasidium pullulans]|nr:hypothetical protein D6D23_04672 [Aureobasidium pullulans]
MLMVKINTVKAANAAFINRQPLTAVFVGATGGIGEATVRQLCKIHGSGGPGLRIIIVGRNTIAAQRIIEECKQAGPHVEICFVHAGDISLLRNVDQACIKVTEILKSSETAQVDMLIMSQGKVEFGGRINTKEGLDESLSLLYYSRMRFIAKLLPHLLSSSLPTGAKVVSIYAAGMETWGKLFPQDLSLDEAGQYSFMNCRTHAIAMKTMFLEDLAIRYPGKLSLTHIYPGLVVHPGFDNPTFPWWFRLIWKVMKPFVRFFPMYLTTEESGQRVLFLCTDKYPAKGTELDGESDPVGGQVVHATDGSEGGGAYSVSYTNEINDTKEFYDQLRGKCFQESVLSHTEQIFQAVETKGIWEPKKKL